MCERQNVIHRIVCTLAVGVNVLILCGVAEKTRAEPSPSKQAPQSQPVAYDRDVKPLLQKLCVGCHGVKESKGHLRVDTLDADVVSGADAETWHDVLDRLNLGEMPPPKAKQPTKTERKLLVEWLTGALREAAESKRYARGRVIMRRLTRYEYQNTMRDLLGVDLNYAAELPPEPLSPDGFLNNGASLEMSPSQIEACLQAARLGLSESIVSGERPTVDHFRKEVTDVGRLPNKAVAGHKPANPEFILGIDKFPRRGEFQVRIRAGAIIPEGHDFPRLRLSLGCLPGIVHVPRKIVGEVDVRASVEEPETFTFRGRIEDFPQRGDVPFGNVDFDGMIALIDFLDADGKELRYADRTYAVPQPKKKPVKKQPAKKGAVSSRAASFPAAPPLPENARLDIVIDSVEFESPVITAWPPASHTKILGPRDATQDSQADEESYARDVLKRFMPRAFRRPVLDAELEATVSFFEAIRAESPGFEDAMR